MLDKTIKKWSRLVRRRFRRRPLLPFLLAATLVVDLVIGFSDDGRSHKIFAALSQAGLLGVWMGRLRSGWVIRAGAALLATGGVTFIILASGDGPELDEALSVFGLYAVVVAVVGALARYAGRLLQVSRRQGSKKEVRFSVLGILTITTVVAVAISLLKAAAFPDDDPVELILAFTPLGLLPLLAAEVVRRVRRTWLAVAGVMAVSVLCAVLFLMATPSGLDDVEFFLGVLAQGAFYAVWLLGLRVTRRPLEESLAAEAPLAPLRVHTEEPPEPTPEPPESTPEPPPSPLDLEA